jgi:hypothetical protein
VRLGMIADKGCLTVQVDFRNVNHAKPACSAAPPWLYGAHLSS